MPLFLSFIESLLHIILRPALVTDRFFPDLVRARELSAPSVLPSVDDCLAPSLQFPPGETGSSSSAPLASFFRAV